MGDEPKLEIVHDKGAPNTDKEKVVALLADLKAKIKQFPDIVEKLPKGSELKELQADLLESSLDTIKTEAKKILAEIDNSDSGELEEIDKKLQVDYEHAKDVFELLLNVDENWKLIENVINSDEQSIILEKTGVLEQDYELLLNFYELKPESLLEMDNDRVKQMTEMIDKLKLFEKLEFFKSESINDSFWEDITNPKDAETLLEILSKEFVYITEEDKKLIRRVYEQVKL